MPKAMIVSPPNEFSTLLAAMLDLRDYSTLEIGCWCLEDCLKILSEEKPDVVVVDVGFPLPHWQFDFRGLECLEMLLETDATKEIPVVAYSIVLDELSEVHERLKSRRIPVVGNPQELEAFIEKIDQIIASRGVPSAA